MLLTARRLLEPAVFIGLLFTGCKPGHRAAAPDRPSPPDHAADTPSDSLVLATSRGVEVWYSFARASRAADGSPCLERGLEIRRDGRRMQVPLLYTGEAPTLLNDSTMRAILWTNCRPGSVYLVDLRNGRPVRQRQASQ
jgi:hypothetical protein